MRLKQATFVLSIILLLSLCIWQVHRYNYKKNMVSNISLNIDSTPIKLVNFKNINEFLYKNITISGKFLYNQPIYFYSLKDNTPGYQILLPFEVQDNKSIHYILVDTGWNTSKTIPRFYRQKLTISGFVINLPRNFLVKFQNDKMNNLWFDLNTQDLSNYLNKDISTFLILLKDSKYLNGKRTSFNIAQINNNSLGYAFTWLTLAIVISFMGLNLKL